MTSESRSELLKGNAKAEERGIARGTALADFTKRVQAGSEGSRDPVHYANGRSAGAIFTEDEELAGYTAPGWYFFTESWAHVHGPYSTEYLCREAFRDYVP